MIQDVTYNMAAREIKLEIEEYRPAKENVTSSRESDMLWKEVMGDATQIKHMGVHRIKYIMKNFESFRCYLIAMLPRIKE